MKLVAAACCGLPVVTRYRSVFPAIDRKSRNSNTTVDRPRGIKALTSMGGTAEDRLDGVTDRKSRIQYAAKAALISCMVQLRADIPAINI